MSLIKKFGKKNKDKSESSPSAGSMAVALNASRLARRQPSIKTPDDDMEESRAPSLAEAVMRKRKKMSEGGEVDPTLGETINSGIKSIRKKKEDQPAPVPSPYGGPYAHGGIVDDLDDDEDLLNTYGNENIEAAIQQLDAEEEAERHSAPSLTDRIRSMMRSKRK